MLKRAQATMPTLAEIDRKIRLFSNEGDSSRPFLCHGSPIGCKVAIVGINPATKTPFQKYWNVETGFNKDGWLAEYMQQHGRLMPTRDRIERLCRALAPLRCLELNLYSHPSRNEAELPRRHRNTELFEFMLSVAKPQVLIVHGDSPNKHLSRLLGTSLRKSLFTSAKCFGHAVDVFAAERHFCLVSHKYVEDIGEIIRKRIQSPGA